MKDIQCFTTLCYIEQDEKYLMLYRNAKKDDINLGKWIGVGGHFKEGESPEECLLREVKEETNLTLKDYSFRGIITFSVEGRQSEYMCLYTAHAFEGELRHCSEGKLQWISKRDIANLPMWEGDRIFFDLICQGHPFFSLKLQYDKENRLREVILDGKKQSV